MPAGTPRTLSVLAILAALVGGASAIVVLPSVWLFLTGAPEMADIAASPFVVAGLFLTVPLLVIAPLAFALAVRRQKRMALSIGIIWWSLVLALTIAATGPVLSSAPTSALLTPALIIVFSLAAIIYFWRLRLTFALPIRTASPVEVTPAPVGPRANRRRGRARSKTRR